MAEWGPKEWRAIDNWSSIGYKLRFHNLISPISSLRLGQLGFHSMILTDKFSPVNLTDPINLLAERSEHVEMSVADCS
jgi:hypothetical protein